MMRSTLLLIFIITIPCFVLAQKERINFEESCQFDFEVPDQEWQCMQVFNDTASGVDNINTFILAKMTELMYLERLDYQLQFLQNSQQPVQSIPNSEWLKENPNVTDENFETAFRQRFQHYFVPCPIDYNDIDGDHHHDDIQFKYIQKNHTEQVRILGFKVNNGLDPELMVISNDELIIILFRGTDSVKDDEYAEWTGTDFRISQMNAGGALVGTKIHTGFWLSFDLIRDELMRTLEEFDASNKKIWVAGHSLGAALSVVTGTYLKASGFNVQNVYAFACPRTIGNKKFLKRANELLPSRIQRFEYFQDPITLLWAPGFKYHHIGQRNWYDDVDKGNFKLYKNTHERVLIAAGVRRYPNIIHPDKKEQRRIKRNQMHGVTFIGMKMLHYHNPQWYVRAAYNQLTEEDKKLLPHTDDSYPYLYYMKENTK